MQAETFIANIIRLNALTGETYGQAMWRVLNNNDVLGLREMMLGGYDCYDTVKTLDEMIAWLTDHVSYDPDTMEILSIEKQITS